MSQTQLEQVQYILLSIIFLVITMSKVVLRFVSIFVILLGWWIREGGVQCNIEDGNHFT